MFYTNYGDKKHKCLMFTQIIQCPISDIPLCENKSANKIVKGYKIWRVLIPHTCVLKSMNCSGPQKM